MIATVIPLLVSAVQMWIMSKLYAMAPPGMQVTSPDTYMMLPWGTMTLAFLIALFAGAGQVADDTRAGAFQFYFARPVTRDQYLVGKVVPVVTLTLFIALGPALLLSLLRLALLPNGDEVVKKLPLVGATLIIGTDRGAGAGAAGGGDLVAVAAARLRAGRLRDPVSAAVDGRRDLREGDALGVAGAVERAGAPREPGALRLSAAARRGRARACRCGCRRRSWRCSWPDRSRSCASGCRPSRWWRHEPGVHRVRARGQVVRADHRRQRRVAERAGRRDRPARAERRRQVDAAEDDGRAAAAVEGRREGARRAGVGQPHADAADRLLPRARGHVRRSDRARDGRRR